MLDELLYRSYANQRRMFPKTPAAFWAHKMAFGDEARLYEKRFLAENTCVHEDQQKGASDGEVLVWDCRDVAELGSEFCRRHQ